MALEVGESLRKLDKFDTQVAENFNADAKDRALKAKAEVLRSLVSDLADSVPKDSTALLNDKSKPTTVAEADERLAKLKKAFGEAATWNREAERLAGLIKTKAEELRRALEADKEKDKDKKGVKRLADIVVDARAVWKDFGAALSSAVEELGKQKTALGKVEGAEDDEGGGEEREALARKVGDALRQLRQADGEKTYPFRIAELKNELFVYTDRGCNASMDDKLKKLMGEAGGVKIYRGDCGFVSGKHVFVSATMPTGSSFAARIQKALIKDVGKKYAIAVGKSKSMLEGEVEAEGDDTDDVIAALIKQRGPDAGKARELQQKLKEAIKAVDQCGVLDSKTNFAALAKNRMLLVDQLVEKRDLKGALAAVEALASDVVEPFKTLKTQGRQDKSAFDQELAKLKPRYEKVKDLKKDDLKGVPDGEAKVKEVNTKFLEVLTAARAAKAVGENDLQGLWDKAKTKLVELETILDKIERSQQERTKGEADKALFVKEGPDKARERLKELDKLKTEDLEEIEDGVDLKAQAELKAAELKTAEDEAWGAAGAGYKGGWKIAKEVLFELEDILKKFEDNVKAWEKNKAKDKDKDKAKK